MKKEVGAGRSCAFVVGWKYARGAAGKMRVRNAGLSVGGRQQLLEVIGRYGWVNGRLRDQRKALGIKEIEGLWYVNEGKGNKLHNNNRKKRTKKFTR